MQISQPNFWEPALVVLRFYYDTVIGSSALVRLRCSQLSPLVSFDNPFGYIRESHPVLFIRSEMPRCEAHVSNAVSGNSS